MGDVDGDGFDEIVYGGCCIDHDGSGLYTTGLGHGDAMHLSRMNPVSQEMQVFRCLEDNPGLVLTNAQTGQVIWNITNSTDVGRAMAADIDPSRPGFELWGTSIAGIYNLGGSQISTSRPSVNFGCWWDGDLLRELLDDVKITKWNYNNNSSTTIFNKYGACLSNNTTKATPNLCADILGDWREEVILRSVNNDALLIYSTTIPTTYRIYTLMHNPQYRLSVAWQNVAYNQPTQIDYFLGDGMTYPPPQPNIVLVDPNPNDIRTERGPGLVNDYTLEQNYPNPFNPSTTIRFSLPNQCDVRLAVFDILGNEIAVLANGLMNAGSYSTTFNGSNFSSGVYFYRLITEGQVITRKLILMR